MNKELHPRSDVARLYISWKNGGRGLIGCGPRVVCQKQYRIITSCSQNK